MSTFERIKGLCKHSLTVFWGYCLLAFSGVMESINLVATILNDPQITAAVTQALGASPRALSVFSSIAGLGAIAARMRSIIRDSKGRN